MSDVRLSIIVPTAGRPTLSRTLRSILDAGFDNDADELIVVSDGPSDAARKIMDFYATWFPKAKFLQGPKTGMYGNTQRNIGIGLSTGSHIAFMDDDDCYSPNALKVVKDFVSKAQDRPHIFKMLVCDPRRTYGLCWRSKDVVLGNIGSPMMVTPNVKSRLGKFEEQYSGDFNFVRSTLDKYPDRDGVVVWVDHFIAYVY